MAPDTRTRETLIGLTGSYCAGKNYIARLLEARGFEVLDVDKLGHRVIEAEADAILKRFGASLRGPDGTIDRRVLGERVFGRPEELAALEAIVHPGVNRMTSEWIRGGEKPGVINAALLHRSVAFGELDGIILVRAPALTRFFRAWKRDRLPPLQLIRRFKSQKNFMSQYLTEKADIYIIDNKGCFNFCAPLYRRSLENRINEILSRLKIPGNSSGIN
ncbi:MAG: dephospho-CoA kinase [Spirochaetaceae bacterium]|jgi:dephospho-CoA kinase|nr:dephospho-CoA kinase [Spirochaetaceae bacterium]